MDPFSLSDCGDVQTIGTQTSGPVSNRIISANIAVVVFAASSEPFTAEVSNPPEAPGTLYIDFVTTATAGSATSIPLVPGASYQISPPIKVAVTAVSALSGHYFSATKYLRISSDPAIPDNFSYRDTVISQYANSPRILRLIDDFNAWINPAANIQLFYDLIWNVDTAQGYGLDIWGRIVGINRVVTLSAGAYFGFAEADDNTETPFNQAQFYSGETSTANYSLDDETYRRLIMAKALYNISDCSIPSINKVMLMVFPGRGDCYATDGDDMTMTYKFTFPLSDVELAIAQTSGILPRPAGVLATVVVV